MTKIALDINPELEITVFQEPVDEQNVDAFLAGANLYVDGLDFFAIDARRLIFRRAAEQGLWSITAGPIGFSTAWLAFDPRGMSFDRYFDIHDGMPQIDQLIAFAVGLTPRATHLAYLDLDEVDLANQAGPSAGLACQLASGVIGAEAMKVLLNKPGLRAAPHYAQFDAYRMKFRQGRLRSGNRGMLQRIKRSILKRRVTGSIQDIEKN